MTPGYQIENVPAYLGMLKLAARSVNLVFLDPPWMAGNRRKGPYFYEDNLSPHRYVADIVRPTIAQADRVLTETGNLAIWVDYRANPYWCVELDRSSLQRNGEIIAVALLGNPGKKHWPIKHGNIILASRNDNAYFDHEKLPLEPRLSADKPGYEGLKRITSILQCTLSNTAPERTGYPDQKDMSACTTVVECLCPPGGVVVDPFCGSGTIPEAAYRTGRVGIGYDTNAAAVQLALARVP